tara:strand:+ start:250 stop:507 length:258 start_codon:yes stop_codon:yes gene_type:complete
MRNEFKMKEATNPQEAIISICDIMKESPLWINKCTSELFILLNGLANNRQRKMWLNCLKDQQIVNLFVELKKEYYHFKDVTQWNY